jgi:hypothetical protein
MKVSKAAQKELSKLLHSSAEGILSAASEAKSFAKKEIPQVCKEIIKFDGIYDSLYQMGVALVYLVILGTISYFIHQYQITPLNPEEDPRYLKYPDGFWNFVHVATIVASFFALGEILGQFRNLLKAVFAPRLYLIEYAKNNILNDDSEDDE